MKKLITVIFLLIVLSACGKQENQGEITAVSEEVTEIFTVITATATTAETVTTIVETTTVTVTETLPVTSRPKSESCKLEVPYYSQSAYPTGCELVSTSMLLAYYDIKLEASELIDKKYVISVGLPSEKDGRLIGGDPDKVFIGSPYSSSSYGCYSGAIFSGLQRTFEGEKKCYKPVSLNGMSLEDICTYYVDYGTPVLVWESISMAETFKDELNTWYIEDTGEQFTWTSNEHCMVLTGFDSDSYYFNDPLASAGISYKKDVAEKRYEEMERQAIAIVPTGKK